MLSVNEIHCALGEMLGPQNVIGEKLDMAPWLTDWRGLYCGNALAIVFPRSTEDVSALVRFCALHELVVIPQGGNTGLCGGATPDAGSRNILVNLSRMTQIRDLDLQANTVIVEAGCILGNLQRLASEHERLFAIDLAAKDSCQIGGNLSTNAGGINVLRYGMARDQVLGLEVVLASGDIWNGLRTLKKDNTGYDLKQLFIGAEGTLGIITAAALKLHQKLNARVVALAALPTPSATLSLLSSLQKHCADRITGFEYFSMQCLELVLEHSPGCRAPFTEEFLHFVLIEVSDVGDKNVLLPIVETALEEAIDKTFCLDVVLATSEAQALELWSLREGISEALHCDGKHLKHDIALPVECIHEFMERAAGRLDDKFPGVRPFIFGHYGDGNLHYNIARPDGASDDYLLENGDHITRIVLDTVSEFNGSFSAEHGIGQLKRTTLTERKSRSELEMMRGIKQLFDPKGIMNPGKVL